MPNDRAAQAVSNALAERFGEPIEVDPELAGLDELTRIAAHSVHRRYRPDPVAPGLLRLLCACALSAPSKSDLQQADVIVVRDAAKRAAISRMIPDMPWVGEAPAFLVFAADGRRLPYIAKLRDKPFPNDHLDLFFNATVDAAIVMTTFLRAAEAVGLGCCPISVIRDRAEEISQLLLLPARVIPIAGMCLGWPAEPGAITPRLGLKVTLHEDRFEERDLAGQIDVYDRRRAGLRPYARQRATLRWGEAGFYGWSEDKARQYSEPARAGFGSYVRAKGFRLD